MCIRDSDRRPGSDSRNAAASGVPGFTACIAEATSPARRRHSETSDSSSGSVMPCKSTAETQPSADSRQSLGDRKQSSKAIRITIFDCPASGYEDLAYPGPLQRLED